MRTDHKRNVGLGFLLLLMLVVAPTLALAQQQKSEAVSANGEGAIKVGREEFKLHAVIVKLFEDGAAELNLASDITIFISAKWTSTDDPKKGIDLAITGGATKGGLTGTGKLFLSDDRKSIVSLKLQAVNTSSRRNIEVNFSGR